MKTCMCCQDCTVCRVERDIKRVYNYEVMPWAFDKKKPLMTAVFNWLGMQLWLRDMRRRLAQ